MRPHVIILGCGFGGLFAARAFRGVQLDVTVVDRVNHHLFQPLLYQVATAGLASPLPRLRRVNTAQLELPDFFVSQERKNGSN